MKNGRGLARFKEAAFGAHAGSRRVIGNAVNDVVVIVQKVQPDLVAFPIGAMEHRERSVEIDPFQILPAYRQPSEEAATEFEAGLIQPQLAAAMHSSMEKSKHDRRYTGK